MARVPHSESSWTSGTNVRDTVCYTLSTWVSWQQLSHQSSESCSSPVEAAAHPRLRRLGGGGQGQEDVQCVSLHWESTRDQLIREGVTQVGKARGLTCV